MTPGFHKPGDEQPRRDDRDNDRREEAPREERREERPARFERNEDARDDRGGDRGPRNDEGADVGRGYGRAAPQEGEGGFRQNRWAPRQERDDRAPRGRDDRGDFRQNDRDDRSRGGFGGGDRRGNDRPSNDRRFDDRRADDRRPDSRGFDNRSSGESADGNAGGGGYQGRPYGGDSIGRGYGKGRPDAGAPSAPQEDRGGFNQDDRNRGGGYQQRDDFRGRDDRNGAGYQQRDDFRGRDDRNGAGYQQRDDRSGGLGGRDDRNGGGYQQRDDRSGGFGGRDDRSSGGYQPRGDFRGRDDRNGGYRGRVDRDSGGYRGRANDAYDRDQRGGYDRDQRGGFDRDQRGGGQESRSQEWKRMARNDQPDDRGDYDDRRRFDDRRQDNRFDDRRQNNRFDDRPSGNRFDDRRGRDDSRSDRRDNGSSSFGGSRPRTPQRGPSPSGSFAKSDDKRRFKPPTPPNLDKDALQEPIRLNKYVARSTRYSRKESDDLVKRGRVTVNGEIVGPGTMIEPGDVVLFDEKPISRRDHLVYILINKPRGVEAAMAAPAPESTDAATEATNEESTDDTADGNTWENDDNQRAAGTLTQVLKFKGTEQLTVVHPLEAEMLGLQLVSNDPELGKHFAKHLPKESFTLDLAAPLAKDALEALPKVEGNQAGILLAEFLNEERTKVSIVIRGEFPSEALAKAGIVFEKADRLHFAGLTKKDLPRGHWRFLGEREITWVTMFQQ